MQLDRRVVVITGGLGALGRAVTAAVRAAGGRAAIIDRSAGEAGADMLVAPVDLADVGQAKSAMDQIASRLGRIDALVNIAGGFAFATLQGDGPQAWADMHRINAMTAVCATWAALPQLTAQRGAVVNIAAAAATARASAGMGAYTASKSGVLRLTESLADELKEAGVRVNAVAPSTLDTPANRAAMPGADFSRWVKPEDLAATIVFLLSDGAQAVTGATLAVTGRT